MGGSGKGEKDHILTQSPGSNIFSWVNCCPGNLTAWLEPPAGAHRQGWIADECRVDVGEAAAGEDAPLRGEETQVLAAGAEPGVQGQAAQEPALFLVHAQSAGREASSAPTSSFPSLS